MPWRIEVGLKDGVRDARGERVRREIREHLGIDLAGVRTIDVYTVDAALSEAEVLAVAAGTALGGVVRVEEEADLGPPMPKMAMMQAADMGGIPTETVAADLTISRRIRAWFSIE